METEYIFVSSEWSTGQYPVEDINLILSEDMGIQSGCFACTDLELEVAVAHYQRLHGK